MEPFIDPAELWGFLKIQTYQRACKGDYRKSLEKQRLTLEETAALINADNPELVEEIKEGARTLKKKSIWKSNCTFCTIVYWKSLC